MMRSQQYQTSCQILLLITDIAIHDIVAAKDCIYLLAELPLSIIIDVGDAYFFLMEDLDGNEVGLRNSISLLLPRYTVQLVQFKKCVLKI